MPPNCEGCGIKIPKGQLHNHYLLCKDSPFLPFGSDEIIRQNKLFEESCNEFNKLAANPHLYGNMNIGDNVMADIPCTGCPTFKDHLAGHCIGNKNVKNYEAEARYLVNKCLYECKKTMDIGVRHYNHIADTQHAKALKMSPDLTPELIAKLTTSAEASNPENVKYGESIRLIQISEQIKSVAIARSEQFLKKQTEMCDNLLKVGERMIEKGNSLKIVQYVVNGKLDKDFFNLVFEGNLY